MLLNRQDIRKFIQEKQIVSGFIDLDTQATPNGFDLTAAQIFSFAQSGALDFSNKERAIPELQEIPALKKQPEDKFGWWHLKAGAYKVRTNETVNLPLDLMAMAFSRTSLLRMGAFTQHGVWDAGFRGKGEFILVVENPQGIALKQNARVAQLVFLRINTVEEGYNGIFHEGPEK